MELGLISKVKEVKETEDIDEVNALVEENWILLRIASSKNKLKFAMGRI